MALLFAGSLVVHDGVIEVVLAVADIEDMLGIVVSAMVKFNVVAPVFEL